MIYSKALDKLLRMFPTRININGLSMIIVPDEAFSAEKIEDLRNVEEWLKETGQDPSITNFLPDDVRPAGVKKL